MGKAGHGVIRCRKKKQLPTSRPRRLGRSDDADAPLASHAHAPVDHTLVEELWGWQSKDKTHLLTISIHVVPAQGGRSKKQFCPAASSPPPLVALIPSLDMPDHTTRLTQHAEELFG